MLRKLRRPSSLISPESGVIQMKLFLAVFFGLFLAATASADSVWTYQGNSQNLFSMNPFLPPPPNPCGCALIGTVTLADASTPLSWNFTAGNESFTSANSTLQAFLGFAAPNPTFSWSFQFAGNDGSFLVSMFSGSINDALDQGGNLSVGSNPGTWSLVSTPEPDASLLLLFGFCTLALLRRRRKSASQTVWEPLA